MLKEARNVGLALLLSLLIVTSVCVTANLFFAPTGGSVGFACQRNYTIACLFRG